MRNTTFLCSNHYSGLSGGVRPSGQSVAYLFFAPRPFAGGRALGFKRVHASNKEAVAFGAFNRKRYFSLSICQHFALLAPGTNEMSVKLRIHISSCVNMLAK